MEVSGATGHRVATDADRRNGRFRIGGSKHLRGLSTNWSVYLVVSNEHADSVIGVGRRKSLLHRFGRWISLSTRSGTRDGYLAISDLGADSFVSIIPFDGSQATTGDGNCIAVEDSFYC